MPKIQKLSQHVADLIAAGEVVERPASVVKELVENAIDAGARCVTVEIQNGGMSLIRVTDDGCGIADEDAETAFLRHATSKIHEAEDLEALHTLGFRGEALAAIASVSKIDLLTKQAAAAFGTSLHLEAGRVTQHEESGCPDGTTILIRDLFYNTPARMKFMRRDSVEASNALSAVQKQALAHPEVAFRFLKDGAELLSTPGDGALATVIYTLFGRDEARTMVEVDGHWEKIAVSGFISRPTATRGTRGYQNFFVNGRFVRSKMLTTALEEAYRNQIMVGRFPACVLKITLPENQVDVNVHPAKTEVKFLREREIFDAVHYAALAALNRTPGRVEMQLPEKKRQPDDGVPSAGTPQQAAFGGSAASGAKGASAGAVQSPVARPAARQESFFRQMTAEEFKTLHSVLSNSAQVKPTQALVRDVLTPCGSAADRETAAPRTENAAPQARAAEAQEAAPPEPSTQRAASEDAADAQQTIALPQTPFRVIGEVFHTYILIEQGGNLLFMDKHAAHERILFEKLRAQERVRMPQLLLTPYAVSLSQEESAVLLENQALLRELGYDFDDLGDGTLLVRQIPTEVELSDTQATLSEFAGTLLRGSRDHADALRDELLHTVACKAAIKAGYHTEPQERDALVREVLSREDLKYCPHGRPILVTLSEGKLRRQFGRS